MLPTLSLLTLLLLPLLTTAHNVRLYSDARCTHDLNWAGLGQSTSCQSWQSWFTPKSFLLDANATDDATIVVFVEGRACDSKTKKFQVANETEGCTSLEEGMSSMQVQNFTMEGGKKVPKGDEQDGKRKERRWLG
jgi:hypothetical protein